jgi:hypothetical protein
MQLISIRARSWVVGTTLGIILRLFSRKDIHVDGLIALFACAKRLGLALKFGLKFPVEGSVPVNISKRNT